MSYKKLILIFLPQTNSQNIKLLNEGVITQEEYNVVKKRLLGL